MRTNSTPHTHASLTSHHAYMRMVTNLISSGRAAAAYRCMRRLKTHPASAAAAAAGAAALLHIYSNSSETYFLILELSRFLPTYATITYTLYVYVNFKMHYKAKKKYLENNCILKLKLHLCNM